MGQVPYEVYFVDRKFWFYNIIQSYLVDGLPSAATLHSRFMIVTDSPAVSSSDSPCELRLGLH